MTAATRCPAAGPEGLTVQETAERTGVSPHTLRYYERAGLLSGVRRDASSGHRRYSAEDVARISTLALRRLLQEQEATLESRMSQMHAIWTTFAARSTTGRRSRRGASPAPAPSQRSWPVRRSAAPIPGD